MLKSFLPSLVSVRSSFLILCVFECAHNQLCQIESNKTMGAFVSMIAARVPNPVFADCVMTLYGLEHMSRKTTFCFWNHFASVLFLF